MAAASHLSRNGSPMPMPTGSGGFSGRRVRSYSRISGYTLLAVLLVSLPLAFVPFPAADPSRLLAVLRELLERSTLSVVGTALLFMGLEAPALPALWECRLARALRPLLLLAAAAYLFTVFALLGVGESLQADTAREFERQLQARQAALAEVRAQLAAVDSSAALRRFLEDQPLLQPVLATSESPVADPAAPLEQQRARTEALLVRVETNLRNQLGRRRADASGGLRREQLRLILTALIYAAFHGLAWLLWPSSLGPLLERVRQARAEALEEAELPD